MRNVRSRFLHGLQASAVARRIVTLPRGIKRAIMVTADSIAMPGCLALSLWLVAPESTLWASPWPWLACTAIAIYFFRSFGLYRSIVRFMGVELIVVVSKSVTITTIGLALTVGVLDSTLVALKIGTVFWLGAAGYLSGSRIAVRWFLQTDRVSGDRAGHRLPA